MSETKDILDTLSLCDEIIEQDMVQGYVDTQDDITEIAVSLGSSFDITKCCNCEWNLNKMFYSPSGSFGSLSFIISP